MPFEHLQYWVCVTATFRDSGRNNTIYQLPKKKKTTTASLGGGVMPLSGWQQAMIYQDRAILHSLCRSSPRWTVVGDRSARSIWFKWYYLKKKTDAEDPNVILETSRAFSLKSRHEAPREPFAGYIEQQKSQMSSERGPDCRPCEEESFFFKKRRGWKYDLNTPNWQDYAQYIFYSLFGK